MKTILQQIDWAEVGQIVRQGLVVLAVLTYLAGWYLGRWLHRANDRLARFWVRLVVPDEFAQLGEACSKWSRLPNPQAQTGLRQVVPDEFSQLGEVAKPQAQTPPRPTGRPEAVHTPVAPMVHPLAELSAGLLELTAAELRAVLGTRQRCSKARLVAAACCW